MAQATLNGYLDDDGGAACTCGFQYGLTPALGTTVTCPGSYITGDSFSTVVTGLLPYTQYYFRTFATNPAGTTYGAILTFTTTAAGVNCSVATLPATVVTENQATLNGMVEDDEGYPGDVSFEWGGDTNYGNATPWLSDYAAGDSFEWTIYRLAPGTAHHYRARFRNRFGIFYGKDMGFGTLSDRGFYAMMDDADLMKVRGVT